MFFHLKFFMQIIQSQGICCYHIWITNCAVQKVTSHFFLNILLEKEEMDAKNCWNVQIHMGKKDIRQTCINWFTSNMFRNISSEVIVCINPSTVFMKPKKKTQTGHKSPVFTQWNCLSMHTTYFICCFCYFKNVSEEEIADYVHWWMSKDGGKEQNKGFLLG